MRLGRIIELFKAVLMKLKTIGRPHRDEGFWLQFVLQVIAVERCTVMENTVSLKLRRQKLTLFKFSIFLPVQTHFMDISPCLCWLNSYSMTKPVGCVIHPHWYHHQFRTMSLCLHQLTWIHVGGKESEHWNSWKLLVCKSNSVNLKVINCEGKKKMSRIDCNNQDGIFTEATPLICYFPYNDLSHMTQWRHYKIMTLTHSHCMVCRRCDDESMNWLADQLKNNLQLFWSFLSANDLHQLAPSSQQWTDI